MGIRFYCPNGHKLNVKEFQAGRTGICPYCGAKTRIPMVSTRKSSRDARTPPVAGLSVSTAGPATGDASASPLPAGGTLPVATPLGQAASIPTAHPLTSTPPPLDASFLVSDPIAEAGNAVWYVQPPSGGQYGPAGPSVMRTWLAEGRVAPNAYVWREGWRDWQLAAEVFPQLAHEQPASSPSLLDEGPVSSSGLAARLVPPRSAENTQVIVIIALVIAILVLLILLVWVVWRENGTSNPAAQWPASGSIAAVAGSMLYSLGGEVKT